jgi:hypothetical protein
MKNPENMQSQGYVTGIRLATVILLWMTVWLSPPATRAASITPAFTYQGNLAENGAPATGLYDLRFTLHGGEIGNAIGDPITNSPVVVTQGYFTVLLDFGPDAFSGAERWLQIGVRTNGSEGSFTTLAPRQQISATPYATFASNIGPIDASLINSGTISLNRLNTNVALLNAQQVFTANNTFNAGVVINPTGEKSPLKIVGGNQVPHLSVTSDTNTTNGAVFSLDTSARAGGNEFLFKVAGEDAAADTGKLIIRNETANRDLLTFSTNYFVGINQNSPTNRLQVGGKVSATSFVGDGSELTGLSADAITSGTLSAGRMNTNVAILTRNNQTFTRDIRFAGTVATGTDSSDNVVLSHVPGNPDRGAISVIDENNTTALSFRATANGGEIDARNPSGSDRATMFVASDGAGKVWTYGTNGGFNVTVGLGATSDHGGIATYGPSSEATAAIYSGSNGGQIDARNVSGQNRASLYLNSVGAGELNLKGTNGNWNVGIGHSGSNPDHGFIGVLDSAGTYQPYMIVADDGQGWVETDVLKINGGADIAEPFQVRPADLELGHKVEPGMLVAIDPEQSGELRLSTRAYDRTVAGIISGAGGVKTGMTLQQKGSIADGDHPVALTGRVWCYVDADAGPVTPGDLLTTSNVPGHAMKVTDHVQAQGAIVGKAMTRLEHGRGLVLVLVSLQ